MRNARHGFAANLYAAGFEVNGDHRNLQSCLIRGQVVGRFEKLTRKADPSQPTG
jgi:hypothetical protein